MRAIRTTGGRNRPPYQSTEVSKIRMLHVFKEIKIRI
jgi:hypothetical protein